MIKTRKGNFELLSEFKLDDYEYMTIGEKEIFLRTKNKTRHYRRV